MTWKRSKAARWSIAVLVCAAWAGTAGAEPPSLLPAGWDAGLKLVEARDTNPDPAIVEVSLTARLVDVEVAPGKGVHAWTYDGAIPGPLIKTHVGDRLIVHFTNDLPQPTTIHWHGVRTSIAMDGVPDISQPEMKRVGERQIWTVKNDSKFAHPFHLHGFFMLPLDEKLEPIHPMAWKDTLNVPVDGTIRFLVVFDERPGMWMFHCHILDHADGGLMGHVHVGS